MQDEKNGRNAQWFARRMPSKDVLADVLQGDPVARLLGIVKDRAVVNIRLDVTPRSGVDDAAIAATLALATFTARRLADQGDQIQLTADEEAALDLFILLVARPAIFVQNGRVAERPENWPEVARDEELLPRVLAGVGRIETSAHVKLGTGFLVGDKRILTNNHVLCALFNLPLEEWRHHPQPFAQRCDDMSAEWTNDPAHAPLFELRGELGSAVSATARLKRVLGHHLEVDMSLIEIDANPAGSRVLPLMAAEPALFQGRRVFAVGYPVDDARNIWGNRITPAPVFRRVFGADDESLGTKRFSPGTVIGWRDTNVFTHDASTLPGSSGSCIVDFEDRRVVGLHYGGRYKDQNYAVSLWKLRDDAVLKGNGITFN
jgi:hypothetical protein